MANVNDLIVKESATVIGDLHIGGELKAAAATATKDGLMSATDKQKLDSTAQHDNFRKYTLVCAFDDSTTLKFNIVAHKSLENQEANLTTIFTTDELDICYNNIRLETIDDTNISSIRFIGTTASLYNANDEWVGDKTVEKISFDTTIRSIVYNNTLFPMEYKHMITFTMTSMSYSAENICKIIINSYNPAPISPKILYKIIDNVQYNATVRFSVNLDDVSTMFINTLGDLESGTTVGSRLLFTSFIQNVIRQDYVDYNSDALLNYRDDVVSMVNIISNGIDY